MGILKQIQSRPRSGQTWITGVSQPAGVQQMCCPDAGCTPTGYGLGDEYLQPWVYTHGYQDVTAMRSGGNSNCGEFSIIKNKII